MLKEFHIYFIALNHWLLDKFVSLFHETLLLMMETVFVLNALMDLQLDDNLSLLVLNWATPKLNWFSIASVKFETGAKNGWLILQIDLKKCVRLNP